MKRFPLLVMPVAVLLAGCGDETPTLPAANVLAPTQHMESRGAVTPTRPAAPPTLVDVAISANADTGEFSTLIAAVLAADIGTELSARGQRTVFAPTDSAFEAIGLDAGNIASVPADELKEILLYHVAPGRRNAASVVNSDRIRMANGGFTRIRTENGESFINDARIVATDVTASNGLIHVIDTVLIP
jgi:transforming growth factor-beta-induced protein